MIETNIDTIPDEEEMMDSFELGEFKKKSLLGAASYMIRSLFLYAISLATSLVLAAYLRVEEFGIFALVTQIIMLLQFVSDVGLGPTLIQKKETPSLDEYRVVFTIQQILSWLIFAIVFALSRMEIISAKLGADGILVLLSLGIALPITSLKIIPSIILERKLDFAKLVIPNIFEQISYSVVLVYLIINQFGLLSFAYAILIRSLIGVMVLYYLQGWSVGIKFNKMISRHIISVGIKFQLSDLLARIKDNLFYLTLGWILPIKEFGYISFSKQWSQVPYMLTVQNVISITFPAYSRLQHHKDQLKSAIEKSIFFISLSIFPILAGMSLLIWPLTTVFVHYQKWQPAIPTFIFFTLSIGWAAFSTPMTSALNAIGQINTTLKLMVIWTVLTYLLTFPLIYFFGFNGVGLSAFFISFTSLLSIYYLKKYVQVEVWPQLRAPLGGGIVMTMIGLPLQLFFSESLLKLVFGFIILSASYLLTIFLIDYKKIILESKKIMSVINI